MSFLPCAAWILVNGADAHERFAASMDTFWDFVYIRSIPLNALHRDGQRRPRFLITVFCAATGSTPVKHLLLLILDRIGIPRWAETWVLWCQSSKEFYIWGLKWQRADVAEPRQHSRQHGSPSGAQVPPCVLGHAHPYGGSTTASVEHSYATPISQQSSTIIWHTARPQCPDTGAFFF